MKHSSTSIQGTCILSKMVTIVQPKNLFANCLFFLLYSFIFAVSGSYDYSTSEVYVGELAGEKYDPNEWYTSNRQRNLVKRNYITRSKSRSSFEENTPMEETEKTNPKISRKWKSQRKRKIKGFAVPESIENATGTINSTEDYFDAGDNMSSRLSDDLLEPSELTNTTYEENDSSTNLMNLKQENTISERNDWGQLPISGSHRMFPLPGTRRHHNIPFVPMNMGKEILNKAKIKPIPTKLPEIDFSTVAKKIIKNFIHQIDHQLSPIAKKENENSNKEEDKDKKNKNDVMENEERNDLEILEKEKKEEKKEEEKKDDKTKMEDKGEEKKEEKGKEKEEKKEEKENNGMEKLKKDKDNEKNVEKSEKDDRGTSYVSSSNGELFQIIPDVFLPMKNNGIIEGKIFPWKVLTLGQYTKEISNGDGSNKTLTTKETKSKLSFLYVNDQNGESRNEKKLKNSSKVYDSENVTRDREKINKIESNESIEQNVDQIDNDYLNENDMIEDEIDATLSFLNKILHMNL